MTGSLPDAETLGFLGKYAFDIWLAYGLSAALILGLVVQSVLAARAARRRLKAAERADTPT